MKFTKEITKLGFFTIWTCKENKDVRIMFDKANNGFYKYEVQKFNEDRNVWDKVRNFHTLKEAKIFCEEV